MTKREKRLGNHAKGKVSPQLRLCRRITEQPAGIFDADVVNTVQPTVTLSEILEHHQGGLVFRAKLDALDEIVAAVVLRRSVAAGVGIEPRLYLELVLQLFITRFPADRMGEI